MLRAVTFLVLLGAVGAFLPRIPLRHRNGVACRRCAHLEASTTASWNNNTNGSKNNGVVGAGAPASTAPLLQRWRRALCAFVASVVVCLCSLLAAPAARASTTGVSGGTFHASTFARPTSTPRREQHGHQRQRQRQHQRQRRTSSGAAGAAAAAAVWAPAPTSSSRYTAAAASHRRFQHPAIAVAQLAATIAVPLVVAPYVVEVVLARCGVRASAVSEVQVLLRLERQELAALVAALQRAVDGGELLEDRVQACAAAVLRRDGAIVGGAMRQRRLTYSHGFGTAQDTFLRLSMAERIKFDDGNDGRPGNAALAGDSVPRTSLAVVTLLLLSRGPVLRSPGWAGLDDREAQRARPLTRTHLVGTLMQLEAYLRRVNQRQRDYLQSSRSDDEGDGQPPGVEINVFWTPNNVMETLTDQDVQRQWPSVRTV